MMNFTNPNRKPQRLDTDNKVYLHWYYLMV